MGNSVNCCVYGHKQLTISQCEVPQNELNLIVKQESIKTRTKNLETIQNKFSSSKSIH